MGGFCSDRLTTARQYRELSKKELSDAIGVSAMQITRTETGQREPAPDEIVELGLALGFPAAFFEGDPLPSIDANAASFRARQAMTARLRDKALQAGSLAHGLLGAYLRQRFRLPAVEVPDLTGSDPELASLQIRAMWQMEQRAIDNMVHLMEAKGVEVYWFRALADCLDAYSAWIDDRPVVMLNTHKDAGDRARFDAAHELGHLALHRSCDTVGSRDQESEANSFAAAFLLPAVAFRASCPRRPSLADLERLKPRWKVSIGAMARRAWQLGLMTDWQYEQMCQEIGRRGWRTREPRPLEREQSALHPKVFAALADKGIAASDVAEALCIPFHVLADLAPTASGFASVTPSGIGRHLRLV